MSTFPEEVLKSAEPVIVNFSLEGCGPCKTIAPFREEIATELAGKVEIVKLNKAEPPELVARYGVDAFPTLAMFKGAEATVADVGFGSLRSWISPRWLESPVFGSLDTPSDQPFYRRIFN
ncbi:thiol reductase thioredoxin [Sinorhizobium meliloti]|nr:thioredoxin domain-containing protein [Sinorhizobium meliloti]RVP08823.1 thiol reductase thioredoxin [Sinorhizobium meliloti]